MNGPAGLAYLDRRERVLKLGESFEKQPRCAFHTVRCECGLLGVPGRNLLGAVWVGDMEADASEFCNSVPAALCAPGNPMTA
ncbi:ELL-associated factor 2 [Cricetulus griseus]|uniref:ELL-associated factor 2 n=1 Tax=Cricetulus griseus TaxID=10029 RepID=G3HAJ3_CRIGR|nr:ELL-associated factor 2 [Cricetulus griseus]